MKRFLLVLVVLLAGCDSYNPANYSFPPGATDKKILGDQWYTFKLGEQCFLGYGMVWVKNRHITKVDCKN